MLGNRSGFTLIELVMVIVILSILAVVAVPRFIDLRRDAMEAAEAGVVGAVRGGIQIMHAKRMINQTYTDGTNLPSWTNNYPNILGGATAGNAGTGATNRLFNYVLDQGITDSSWNKVSSTSYTFNNGGTDVTYTYDITNGTFTKP